MKFIAGDLQNNQFCIDYACPIQGQYEGLTDRCDRGHSLWRYHAVWSPPISAWRFCVYPRLALQMPCWKACHCYSLDLASFMELDRHSLSWNSLNPKGKGCFFLTVFCKFLKNAESSWDLSNVEFPVLRILYFFVVVQTIKFYMALTAYYCSFLPLLR